MIDSTSDADEATWFQLQQVIYVTIVPALAMIAILIGFVKPAGLSPNAFEGCYIVDRGPTIELSSKHLMIADGQQAPRAATYLFAKAYDIYVSGHKFSYRTVAPARRVVVSGNEDGQIIHMLASPRGGRQMLVPVDRGFLEVPRSPCSAPPTEKPPA